MDGVEGSTVLLSYLLHAGQLSDDLVGVALIDQEPLSLQREVHLHRVLRDKGIEEGIVLFRYSSCQKKALIYYTRIYSSCQKKTLLFCTACEASVDTQFRSEAICRKKWPNYC